MKRGILSGWNQPSRVSSAFAHRYRRKVNTIGVTKCRLSLKWKDFTKDVLVTLNDRTEMVYPLLIGRNFLRGDFIVDVDQDNPD